MSLPRIPGPCRGGGHKFQFTLSTAVLVLTVASCLSWLFFATPFVLTVVHGGANVVDTAAYRIPNNLAADLEFFQTQDALWVICGAATFVLTVPLAAGVFLLGPSRGFLAFWFLSLASLAMFAGAVLSGTPLLGDSEITRVTSREIIHVFCHFPIFFIPLATGAAWYLSDL